ETEAMDEINRIEEMGGAVKAVELNYFQNAIARSAYQYQKQIDAQERVVVGVNKFALEDEEKTEIMKISLEAENDQVKKLKTLRLQRDNIAVKESLTRLKIAAGESTSHLMEPILSAVEAYCTIGEISNALREVWGEYGKRL
ncbi:MAG: methylmalonyl-CoA mutase, partial [Calditrichaeota bacterium]|nr:methylmalonyl-CoA mutase [Calditrichota bacterium]